MGVKIFYMPNKADIGIGLNQIFGATLSTNFDEVSFPNIMFSATSMNLESTELSAGYIFRLKIWKIRKWQFKNHNLYVF